MICWTFTYICARCEDDADLMLSTLNVTVLAPAENNCCCIHLEMADVELNPGPKNQQKSTKSIKTDETPDFPKVLLRLDKKLESSQESILENLGWNLSWIYFG